MKKIGFLALTAVLTAAMLVGCGCTNQRMDNTSAPTVLPTNEENWVTQSTTQQTTATGETGVTGETGGTGANGGNGANGDTGTNGSTGANGGTGTNGGTGANGGSTESTADRGNGPLEDGVTTQPTTR